MPSVDASTLALAVSAASTAASIGGQIAASGSSNAAAAQQAGAANQAAGIQAGQYNTTRGDFASYRDVGANAASRFNNDTIDQYGNPQQIGPNLLMQAYNENPGVNMVGTLPDAANVSNFLPDKTAWYNAAPGSMSQAELEATPGYQFSLEQGLRATQNSAAARGLGVSGAAMKGAATFATGLANQTYKDQFAIKQQQFANQGALFGADQTRFQDQQQNFNNQQQIFTDQNNQNQLQFQNQQQRFANLGGLNTAGQGNLQSSFNRLSGLTTLGQTSAYQGGIVGNAAANNQGNFMTGAGTAQAAGTLGSANEIRGIGNALANGLNSYSNTNRLYSSGGAGGAGGSSQYADATPGQSYSPDGTPLGQGYYNATGEYYK